MKHKLRSVIFLSAILLVFLPLNRALALVVNSPVVTDRGDNQSEKAVAFAVLTFESLSIGENSNSELPSILNNLPMVENETSLSAQGFMPPWMDLNVKGIIDQLTPSPIPTSVLLLGTSLIGLIGIARRSVFTS